MPTQLEDGRSRRASRPPPPATHSTRECEAASYGTSPSVLAGQELAHYEGGCDYSIASPRASRRESWSGAPNRAASQEIVESVVTSEIRSQNFSTDTAVLVRGTRIIRRTGTALVDTDSRCFYQLRQIAVKGSRYWAGVVSRVNTCDHVWKKRRQQGMIRSMAGTAAVSTSAIEGWAQASKRRPDKARGDRPGCRR